ncbi:MAG TPA: heavy-metal-associated domain-containing protein [Gemmatales bacterium]|nr:heavy-metal-associated domain-containing protein [Gemmatales bacterium]
MMRLCLLAGMVLGMLVNTVGAADAPAPPDDAAVAAAAKALKVAEGETLVFIEDMHCSSCAKKVAGRLFKVKGVMRVRTSVKHDAAVITPQAKKAVDVAATWATLQEGGYPPTRLIGPEGTFVPDDETREPVKVADAASATRT